MRLPSGSRKFMIGESASSFLPKRCNKVFTPSLGNASFRDEMLCVATMGMHFGWREIERNRSSPVNGIGDHDFQWPGELAVQPVHQCGIDGRSLKEHVRLSERGIDDRSARETDCCETCDQFRKSQAYGGGSAEAVGEKEAGSESRCEKDGDGSECGVLCQVERYRPCTWGG